MLRLPLQEMRRRWADQYGGKRNGATSGLESEENGSSGNASVVNSIDFLHGMPNDDCVDSIGPSPTTPSFVNCGGESLPGDLDLEQPAELSVTAYVDAKRPKYTIVDKSPTDGAGGDSLASVSQAVPDVLEKEAVRLTDSRQFKYPWEKGRLSKIFGGSDSALSLVPKIQPSAGNFVKLSINVDAEASLSSSMGVAHVKLPDLCSCCQSFPWRIVHC